MKDAEIIKQFAAALLIDAKKAVPKASGRTAESLENIFDKDGLGFKMIAGSQIESIIDGRKPTKQGAKKGSPTLQQQILGWIKTLSIQPVESTMSQLSLSWAISTSIHKKGYKGRGNIFDKVFTDNRFDSITKTLLDNKSTVASSDIIKQFKF